jgi:hypothetical protein
MLRRAAAESGTWRANLLGHGLNAILRAGGNMHKAIVAVVRASAVAGLSVAAAGQVAYSVVAKTGDLAPDTEGRVFDRFGAPALNNAGRVIFFGDLTGSSSNDFGIWSNASGSTRLVVREGGELPAISGTVNARLNTFAGFIDDNNETAFLTDLTGAGIVANNDYGLWSDRGGSRELLARQGDPVPGTGPGIVHSGSAGLLSVKVGRTGIVGMHSVLVGSGVTFSNDRVVMSEAIGSLQPVARESSPAPGLGGATFLAIRDDISAVGDLGQIAFYSTLDGAGVTSASDESMWYADAAGTQLLGREDDLIPGFTSAVVFNGFGEPGMSRNGLAAFTATMSGVDVTSATDRGIFVGTPGDLELVVREGDQAPGLSEGATFGVLPLTAPSVNSDGRIVIEATMTGTDVDSANNTGVWTDADGAMRLLAREGFSAPELAIGVIFTDNFSQLLINDVGQVAFVARVTGPGISSGSDDILWATDSLGSLVLVMQEGVTQIDVDPDPGVTDLRTVDAFGFLSEQGWNGFNDRGELGIDVTFTDGTDAVVIAAIPVITQCPNCPADYDQDGGVTGADIAAFFTDFEGGLTCADTDEDGGITGADIAAFFVTFEAGGC